ncbi:MAG: hypothetical protein ACFFCW_00905 [Candidatus Hodarchaeota archaeon]
METIATWGVGVDKVVGKILDHRKYLNEIGLLENKRIKRIQQEIFEIIKN